MIKVIVNPLHAEYFYELIPIFYPVNVLEACILDLDVLTPQLRLGCCKLNNS